MTVLLAALAGICAAAGIVGLAEVVGERRGRRERSGRGERRAWAERRAPGERPAWAERGLSLAARLAGPARGGRARADKLERLLDAAGAPRALTVGDVLAVKGAAAAAGGLLALPAASLAPGRLWPVVLLAGPLAGFLAPDAALRRRARARAARIDLELADVAELVRVAVEAGLAPMRALEEVGRRHPGVLAAELRAAAARMRLGVPHDEALATLERRAPVAGVTSLAAALRRAGRHGAPAGPALDALAADARAERARRIRERAARAAPKIQLVVALLLVPAVLLLVAAALAAALKGGGA